MKLGLKAKIVLITVVVLSVTAGAGTVVSGYIFFETYGAALKSRVSVIGETLASQLNRLLALGIPLDELVGFDVQCQDILKNHEGISYAMVVDPDGRILFHNDPAQNGKRLTEPLRMAAIQDSRKNLLVHAEPQVEYYESLQPVLGNDGRHVGDVIIGFPVRLVSQQTGRLVAYSTGIALITIGFAVLLLIAALSSWVSSPLIRLLTAIQGVKNKGTVFTEQVEIVSRDEIGEIASEFNQMMNSLRQMTVSRDYMDNLLENMMDTLVVVGADGLIQTVNQAVCRLLGHTRDELIGHPVSDILIRDEQMGHGSKLDDLIAGKGLGECIRYYRAKDNTPVPVLFGGSAIRDQNGAIRHVVFTGRDITGQMQQEKEREKLIRELQEALSEIRKLSGMLPICASCKKIRDDKGYWTQIESYIQSHSEAEFSHGICPECAKKLYPEFSMQ